MRRRRGRGAAVLVVMFMGLLAVTIQKCVRQSGSDGSAGERMRRPIDELLRSEAPAAWQEGVAAALLIDTSGSMARSVPDLNDRPRSKMEIAHEAALSVVRRFEEFAEKHPDSRLLVGVYEFSSRDAQPSCRQVVPLGPPDLGRAEAAIRQMEPKGGTPIGSAMIEAKLELDRSGLTRRHVVVVTDGENNRGYAPGDVARAILSQPQDMSASVYFVAFDIAADRFNAVKEAGGLVLQASNERDLGETLDFVLTGKILVEQPTSSR